MLLVLPAALPAHARAAGDPDPLAELRRSCALRESADRVPVAYRICSARLPGFDGTPLDATVTLPARAPRRRLPLVVFLHGLLNDKREYLSATREGTGPDRGADAYKTIHWNNVWFASRGYAVLSYSARGHGDSGGEINLSSRAVEVRDARRLIGLLVDDARSAAPIARIDPRRVAVLGSSYGGGQAWLLLTTREDADLQYGEWRSPRGARIRLAALVPQYTWTDLLAALAPNGHVLRTPADRSTGVTPLGIGKQTLINGFLATAGARLPRDTYGWIARLDAGEPYDSPDDPVVPVAKRELTLERSAFHQEGFFAALRARRQRRVPILALQGWTDPIFPPIETLRMMRALRAASPRYPIGLYLGDFEHLTALVKVPDLRYGHDLGNRLLDRVLRRRGPRPRFDVRSARTDCDPARFGPVTVARDWAALHPGRVTLELAGPQQTVSPLSDQRGPASDPVAVSLQRGRGCIRTTLPPTPGIATWTVPVTRAVTLAGLPRLTLRYRTAAPDLELDTRLWDVAPGGEQTLVTRGAYRAVGSDPAGENTAVTELFGNHWRFEPGHSLMLEVTQVDSSYLRQDNFASTATIDAAVLTLPTAERR